MNNVFLVALIGWAVLDGIAGFRAFYKPIKLDISGRAHG